MRWRYPQSKNVYSNVQRDLPVFQCVSITPDPAIGTAGKSLAPSLVQLQVFIHINEAPMSLFQAAEGHLSQSFITGKLVQTLKHLCDTLPNLSASICLFYWGVQNWTQLSRGVTSPGLNKGEGSSPLTCWQHPNAPNAAADTISPIFCDAAFLVHV